MIGQNYKRKEKPTSSWLIDYSILATRNQCRIERATSRQEALQQFYRDVIKDSEESEMVTIHSVTEDDLPLEEDD